MDISQEQRTFMLQLIDKLEALPVEEIVYDMTIKKGDKNYIFKYIMSKEAPKAS